MKLISLLVLKIKTIGFRKQHPEDPAFSWTAVKALVVVIMWFSVVWASANCSNFALHPNLTPVESTVSRHPLLFLKRSQKPKVCPLHQLIPMFISEKTKYEESCRDFWSRLCFLCLLRMALSQSNLGINSCQLHRKRCVGYSLQFWMGLGPFLGYLLMYQTMTRTSHLARIQILWQNTPKNNALDRVKVYAILTSPARSSWLRPNCGGSFDRAYLLLMFQLFFLSPVKEDMEHDDCHPN